MSNLPELRITTISERRLSLQVQQTEREPKAYISLDGWGSERGYSDLTSEEAYKIVDFITENIERPEPPKEPTVAEQVFALPIGAQFRWGWDDGVSRVKVSESRYWSSLGDTTYPIEDLDNRAQVEVIE